MAADPDLPLVFQRADALRAGLTRNQIETRLRNGRWVAVRRGVFCLKDRYDALPDAGRIEVATLARQASSRRSLAVSHISAAAIWHLPLPLDTSAPAALTDGDVTQCTRVDEEAVIQVARLWPGDTYERDGLLVTSPARTVADCLRHYPAQTAVPIADAALHQRLTDPTAVRAVLGRQALWPYAARAEESWRLVDGRRESWLESVSAVRLWRVGIEPGEPQVEILDARGRFLARVDFLWPEEATVGEADGQAKYVATGKPALLAEKKREDALRDIGLEVVRWGTAEVISAPEAVARRIRRARARGSRTRFAGSWRFMPAI